MVDLHFADEKDKKRYRCDVCPKLTQERNKCQEPGYQNVKRMRVDLLGSDYTFCPGKATWDISLAQTFIDCRVALEAGIFPSKGGLNDQYELFTGVFYDFMDHWKARSYARVMKDSGMMAHGFIEMIVKAISGKGGSGRGPMSRSGS